MVKGATWLRGRYDPNRKVGREGVEVVLLDVSGSMRGAPGIALKATLDQIMGESPGIYIVVFACKAGIIRSSELDDEKRMNDFGGSNATLGLECAIPLRPERSILISDGEIYSDCKREKELAKLQSLTGSLSTVWVHFGMNANTDGYPHEYRDNLIELARHGGGQCRGWDGTSPRPLADIIRTIAREEPSMAKNQLPDHFLEDDEFEFDLPEEVVVDLRRKVTLLRGTVFTEQFHEPEWHKNGGPVRQRIGVQPPQITINEPRGVISKALGWLTNAPEVDAPREVNRGFLQEAPQQAALPSSGPVLALPAPSRPALVPQLSDSREQPMDSAERVAAIFRKR